jgi:hypothetical protein
VPRKCIGSANCTSPLLSQHCHFQMEGLLCAMMTLMGTQCKALLAASEQPQGALCWQLSRTPCMLIASSFAIGSHSCSNAWH